VNFDPLSAFVAQAQAQIENRDYRGAIGSFTLALGIEDRAEVRVSRGLLHSMTGNIQAALDDFSVALERDPQHLDAREHPGRSR